MSERVIDLHKTNLKSALKIMMAETNVNSFADLARNIKVKETTFRSAINNGSLRLNDFLKLAKFMGYSVIIQSAE